MSLERRFQLGFDGEPTSEAGLVMAGDVATLVKPDGTREPVNTGGGSQPEKIVVQIAYNTPDLVLTGIALTTIQEGDIILTPLSFVSIDPDNTWDGTTPAIGITDDNSLATWANLGGGSLESGDGVSAGEKIWFPALDAMTFWNHAGANRVVADGTLYAIVQDGSGGDPGSMQGAGEIVLFIMRAA